MNKKLIRNIIIAIAAIAVLGFGYYFAVKWEPGSDEAEPSEQAAEEIVAFEMNEDEFKSLRVENEKGGYTVIKADDGYTINGLENVKLSSGSVSSAVTTLKKLTATKKLDFSADKLGEYGLSAPAATITAEKTDGSTAVIKIGDKTPTSDGYYCLINDNLYVISTYYCTAYLEGADYFKDKSIASIDMTSELQSLEIDKNGEKIVQIRQKGDEDVLSGTVNESLIMTYPFYEYVTSDKLLAAFEGFNGITAVEIAEDNASNPQKYGIGKYTFKIQIGDTDHVIKLGDRDDKGNVYAMYDGNPSLFTTDSTLLDIAEKFTPFDYIYKFIHIYSIDDVSDVEYNVLGKVYKLHIEGKDDSRKYSVNGSEVEEDPFKKIYQSVIGIMFTSENEDGKLGAQIGSITFTFNDGHTETAEYYEHDDRNYAVKISSGKTYLLLKKNLTDVPQQIDKNLNG